MIPNFYHKSGMRCPACGDEDGQTHHGAERPSGGREHICRECLEWLLAAIKRRDAIEASQEVVVPWGNQYWTNFR